MNNITNTMEWAMVELLQNPSSMANACEELSQVVGFGRNVEEGETGRLPYLQAVINETLRLHPPAPLLLPHHADATIEVAGYTVPKGSRVLVNMWAMGHDEDIWPEPEEFMPERFLGRNVDFRGGEFELIPFGAGRRICPGMPLAIKLVHVILGSLLN
jgi:cytochrome P450